MGSNLTIKENVQHFSCQIAVRNSIHLTLQFVSSVFKVILDLWILTNVLLNVQMDTLYIDTTKNAILINLKKLFWN